MTCYNPIPACYSKKIYEKTGKKEIHLVSHENYKGDEHWIINEKYFPHATHEYIYLPCRKCAGCRSDNAKMWMIRAYNEMKLHKNNCFITLTYADESPIVHNDPLCLVNLRYSHFQKFIKRLRKRFDYPKLKYLMCGEYGLKNQRAHFHAILFNFDFDDKKLIYMHKGYPHYSSQSLNELWSVYDRKNDLYVPIGFTDLADCDIDCCSYVSQYVLKKLDVGNQDVTIYGDELIDRCPPFIRSSRNPAIGLDWFKKFGENAVENGFIYVPSNKDKTNFTKIKTPRYYYSKFEEKNPEKYTLLKNIKDEEMKQYYKDNPVNYDKLRLWAESHLHRIKQSIKNKLTPFIGSCIIYYVNSLVDVSVC